MSHHPRLIGIATVSLSKCLLLGSRPIAFRHFALLFSAIARFVKASALIAVAAAIRDSECEHFKTASRHGSLHRTPRYVHAVAQSHEHSEIGESAKNSQVLSLSFRKLPAIMSFPCQLLRSILFYAQLFTEKWELYTKSEISNKSHAPVQQEAETPEKVAVDKPMPRVAASPKSTFKRKRTDDLDAVSKEQKNQKLAGHTRV